MGAFSLGKFCAILAARESSCLFEDCGLRMSYFWKILITLGFFVSLTGCGLLPPVAAPDIEVDEVPHYQSELADPSAKALFAFTQFRLLAAEERWDEAFDALQRAQAFDPESDYLRLNLAKANLHLEKLAIAIDQLLDLLGRDPENLEIRVLLGDVYSYQKRFPEAVEQFREAVLADPDNELLQIRLAMALSQSGAKEDAVEILEVVAEDHPDASLAQLSLARFYNELGERSKALEKYQELLDYNPGLQQAIVEYGRLLEQDNTQAALELYESAVIFNPRAASVRQRLAQLYLNQHQVEKARDQLEAVSAQFPSDLQVAAQLGLVYLELRAWPDAERIFQQLLDSGMRNQRIYYFLALAQEEQGKVDQAIANLEQVSVSSEKYFDAALHLAYLYRQKDLPDKALDVLRQIVARDPQQENAYYYLVAFTSEVEGLESAFTCAVDAVAANPGSARLAYQYAILQEKRGQREDAVRRMEHVLELDADHAEALNFLAYHQAENSIDLELALSRVKKALLQGRHGHMVDTLGWIYYKMGRFEESRRALEEAVALLPADPYVLDHLGDVYRALELWDKARQVYQSLLESNPDFAGVREKLDSIPAGED